jgi:hypothetical protein
MKSIYYYMRCVLGRPICYRDGPFAMCKSCHTQSESHRF